MTTGHAPVVLAWLLVPAAAFAQPPASPALTLRDAVRLTLEHSFEIRQAEAETSFQRGVLQEEAGMFDSSFGLRASLVQSEEELTPELFAREEARRRAFFLLGQAFGRLREQLADNLARG